MIIAQAFNDSARYRVQKTGQFFRIRFPAFAGSKYDRILHSNQPHSIRKSPDFQSGGLQNIPLHAIATPLKTSNKNKSFTCLVYDNFRFFSTSGIGAYGKGRGNAGAAVFPVRHGKIAAVFDA